MGLPVIVGIGGINPAGRSSSFHAYRRTVIDALAAQDAGETYAALAVLMNLAASSGNRHYRTLQEEAFDTENIPGHIKQQVIDGTLIRKIDNSLFDPARVPYTLPISPLSSDKSDTPDCYVLKASQREFLKDLPPGVEVTGRTESGDHILNFSGADSSTNQKEIHQIYTRLHKKLAVSSAGMLPAGLNLSKLYNSNHHPRGIQMSVYAASDAIYSSGFSYEELRNLTAPDLIGVYASSSIGQSDDMGFGGYSRAMLEGKEPTSKQLAFGMPQMPGDFVNGYILGTVGYSTGNIGACATFLYNLSAAAEDIKTGRRRIAIVGCAEAAVSPHIISAYNAMGALSNDEKLMQLDGLTDPEKINYRRACRPFSDNKGFIISESAQFLILFDSALALETGANILGAVPEVYINADGYKPSISKPGIGNYISFAKAAGAVKGILGDASLKRHTAVYAHGTGTPQNRQTESAIISKTAQAFDADCWQVAAIKCFLGHPTGPAAGDQISNALGVWRYGILPGITTIDHIAADVTTERLQFNLAHQKINPADLHTILINSKGFGGNNATGVLVSPQKTMELLHRLHGKVACSAYEKKNQTIAARSQENEQGILSGELKPIYKHYGEKDSRIINDDNITITPEEIKLNSFDRPVSLTYRSNFGLSLENEPAES